MKRNKVLKTDLKGNVVDMKKVSIKLTANTAMFTKGVIDSICPLYLVNYPELSFEDTDPRNGKSMSFQCIKVLWFRKKIGNETYNRVCWFSYHFLQHCEKFIIDRQIKEFYNECLKEINK